MDSSSPSGRPGLTKYFSSTGKHHDDRAHLITLEMLTKYYNILGFELTPDREAEEELKPLPSGKCAQCGTIEITATRIRHLHFGW